MRSYVTFARRIGLLGISQIAAALSSFLLLAVLTKNLAISDFGVWVELNVTINVVAGFATLGMPFTMTRFLAAATDKEEIQNGFYSISLFVFTALLLVSLLFLGLAQQISALLFNGQDAIARLAPAAILFSGLNIYLVTYFRTFQQIKRYTFFSTAMVYSNVAFVALFVFLDYGLFGAVVGLLVNQLIFFALMMITIVLEIGARWPKFVHMREYLAFGLPSIPANMSYWAVDSSDRYLIGVLLGAALVGYYSAGYTLGGVILVIFGPLSLLLAPALSKSYDEHDMHNVEKTLEYSLKYFLTIAIPLVFSLTILSRLILSIISTQQIASQAYVITPFVALGYLFFGVYGIVSHVLVLVKKTRVLGSIWIFVAAINVLLNVILLPRIGTIAAAATTLIAFVLAFAITEYLSLKLMTFHFDWLFLSKALFASSVISAIIIVWNPQNLISLSLLSILCAAVYFTILLLLKGFRAEEYAFLREFIKIRS